MFGFPLVRSFKVIPEIISLDTLMESYFGKEDVDLEGAKLLDTYAYEVSGLQYVQKVYRLANGALYTETVQDTEASKIHLENELNDAIKNQEFEKAAVLRDKLKAL